MNKTHSLPEDFDEQSLTFTLWFMSTAVDAGEG